MHDLFDHNIVNLADYIAWNDRINLLKPTGYVMHQLV